MTAATMRTTTITSMNWAARMRHGFLKPLSTSSLRPCSARRRATSAWLSPVSGGVFSVSRTWPGVKFHACTVCFIHIFLLRFVIVLHPHATVIEQQHPPDEGQDDQQGVQFHKP